MSACLKTHESKPAGVPSPTGVYALQSCGFSAFDHLQELRAGPAGEMSKLDRFWEFAVTDMPPKGWLAYREKAGAFFCGEQSIGGEFNCGLREGMRIRRGATYSHRSAFHPIEMG